MEKKKLLITLDSREKKLIKIYNKKKITFKTEALNVGDIELYYNVINDDCTKTKITVALIERKTFPDFLSSCNSGRKDEQINRLIEDTGKNIKKYYLIEGKIPPTSNVKRIKTAISNIRGRDGLSIIRTDSIMDTAKEILRLRKSLMLAPKLKGDVFTRTCALKIKGYTKKNYFLSSLMGITGIGKKTAEKIGKQYNYSLLTLMLDLQKGIFPKLNKKQKTNLIKCWDI
jgi:ERCC4-type nuclease